MVERCRCFSISLAATLDRCSLATERSHSRARRRHPGIQIGRSANPTVRRQADRADATRRDALPGDPRRQTRLRAGNRLVCARVRRGRARSGGNSLGRERPGASISAATAKSSRSPMATARSAGCAGATGRSFWLCSSTRGPKVGRVDADRLLHGLARRRGPDRLARQSRLGSAGRLLPGLALFREASTVPTSCNWF